MKRTNDLKGSFLDMKGIRGLYLRTGDFYFEKGVFDYIKRPIFSKNDLITAQIDMLDGSLSFIYNGTPYHGFKDPDLLKEEYYLTVCLATLCNRVRILI